MFQVSAQLMILTLSNLRPHHWVQLRPEHLASSLTAPMWV